MFSPGFTDVVFVSMVFPKLSSCLSLEAFLSISFLQEANEAGALRLAKSKLEKQLEDLTLRLQLEKRLRVWLIFAAKTCFGVACMATLFPNFSAVIC